MHCIFPHIVAFLQEYCLWSKGILIYIYIYLIIYIHEIDCIYIYTFNYIYICSVLCFVSLFPFYGPHITKKVVTLGGGWVAYIYIYRYMYTDT